MTDVIYQGTNGQILVDNLVLTDKAGTGESQIRAVPSGTWTARGFKTEYEALTGSTLPLRDSSGKVFTNDGAVGPVQVTLPPPSGAGISLTFVRIASFAFRVNPQAADAIIYSGGQMDDGEYLELASDGASLALISDANDNWIATLETGTLVEETP